MPTRTDPDGQRWEPEAATVARYANLFRCYLSGRQGDADFVETFLIQWKRDRDGETTTGRIIDDVMTATDCYSPSPDDPWEIDGAQLRLEVESACSLGLL